MPESDERQGIPYADLPGLADYYLEDSFVLGIRPSEHELAFDIEAVLTPSHPEFGPPHVGEMHRYRPISLRFTNARQIDWIEPMNLRPNRDPDGSIDFGNIDFFALEDGRYRLGGSWGEVAVVADLLVVEPANAPRGSGGRRRSS